jgi:hypothetical protein
MNRSMFLGDGGVVFLVNNADAICLIRCYHCIATIVVHLVCDVRGVLAGAC